jgi:hypothetical protein
MPQPSGQACVVKPCLAATMSSAALAGIFGGFAFIYRPENSMPGSLAIWVAATRATLTDGTAGSEGGHVRTTGISVLRNFRSLRSIAT